MSIRKMTGPNIINLGTKIFKILVVDTPGPNIIVMGTKTLKISVIDTPGFFYI